jgi:hypothetical protein
VTEQWMIGGMLLALAVLGVVAVRLRQERDGERQAAAAALSLVRQAWPPLHLLTTSPHEEVRRAGVVLQQLIEDLEDCLRQHAPPAVDEGGGSADSDPPPEQLERQGVQTRRVPRQVGHG